MNWRITEVQEGDWPHVLEIYVLGIASRNATFETAVPEMGVFTEKFSASPRLVARGDGGEVLGWAMLSPVSSRCVYGGVAEVSVYVHGQAKA
jgi:L-amino acid N-acyltransferase YncA